MNLGEIIESIRDVSAKQSTNDLADGLKRSINRAYRRLCRARTFGALVVRGETITTVSGTMSYALPYPMDRIINDSLRYDQTSQLPGSIVTLRDAGSVTRTIASALYSGGSAPIMASISNGAIVDFASQQQTDSTLLRADSLYEFYTGSLALPASTWVGRWVLFGADRVGRNGGDYGYKITAVSTVDHTATIEKDYRGPDLTGFALSVTPANSQWLHFDPVFTDSAKTVTFDWYSKPARLYNDYDIPEIPELSDAIVARVLADNPIYHRPDSYDRMNYVKMAREELMSALKTGVQ